MEIKELSYIRELGKKEASEIKGGPARVPVTREQEHTLHHLKDKAKLLPDHWSFLRFF